MKVFFLTGSLEIGGAQQQLVTLARGLARRGHIVGVILFYPGGSLADGLESHGVTLYDIGKRSRWDLLGPFVRLVRLLRAEDPDLLYAFMGSANVAAALAGLFVRGVKIVFGVRCSNMDWSKYDVMSRVVTSLQAWLSPLAHFFIVNSKAGLIATRASGISIPGSVIANGIDTSRFRPDAVARAEWRRRLNVNDTTLLIGMLARRDPMKDHEGFLSAAKMITTVRSDVAFILAGPGVDRSDQILSQLADEVGAPVYLLGACAQPERLLAAWDVSVLASRFGEGFPNVVGEAMACGLPCVVTDVGDSGDVIGGLGWTVPAGDPSKLAEACLEAIRADPALGVRARRRIKDHFSVISLAEQTELVLQDLCKPTVLHVITSLDIGGAQRMLARLVTSSTRFRHVVASMISGGALTEGIRDAGVSIVELGMHRGTFSLNALLVLLRLIWRERPALLQSWMYHADLLTTLAALISGRLVAWNLRCSDLDLSRYRRLTRVVLRLLKMLSSVPVVVVTNSVAGQTAHTALGFNPREWELIPNGFDLSVFRPDAVARAEWRRRLNVNDTTLLIGMLARRDPMKDHEGFLSAAKMITTVRSDVAFILAGPGVDRSDQILSQLADEVGAPVYLLGACAQPERLLAAWDVSVLASRFGEGFPNVVGEAMACGLPCVVTDVGDSGLILGATGRLVPRGDPKELAEAILDTLADADARRDMGIAARRRIEDKFALSVVITKYDALYSRLLEGELAT